MAPARLSDTFFNPWQSGSAFARRTGGGIVFFRFGRVERICNYRCSKRPLVGGRNHAPGLRGYMPALFDLNLPRRDWRRNQDFEVFLGIASILVVLDVIIYDQVVFADRTEATVKVGQFDSSVFRIVVRFPSAC